VALTIRQLLEQLGGELDVELELTVHPGTRAEEVLNHQIWSVSVKATPDPQAVFHDGIIYLTNKKENML
jgi:azurin